MQVVLDNGSIQLSFSGGDGLWIHWTGPNGFTSTDNNLFNLSPGIYNLLVNDGSAVIFQIHLKYKALMV